MKDEIKKTPKERTFRKTAFFTQEMEDRFNKCLKAKGFKDSVLINLAVDDYLTKNNY